LAIVGRDGNLYRYEMAAGQLSPITSDGELGPRGRFYTWPTWSRDGQLAFFGASAVPNDAYDLGVFILGTDGQTRRALSVQGESFTYASWAPADCPAGNCRDLALLYSNAEGLGMRLIRSGEQITQQEVDSGGPFYWDWSPDASQMVWARFGRSFYIYDVAGAAVQTELPYEQGVAQSAADWSPVDGRLILAIADAGGTALLLVDGESEQVLVENLAVGAAFDWSPTGEQLAYLDWERGTLNLVEVASGRLLDTPSEGVLAFFWSPDGSKIAYVVLDEGGAKPGASLNRQGQAVGLRWAVYDVAKARARFLSSFQPTQEMLYYLQFFDQFARSHSLWSPDSRYLAFGEVLGGEEFVTVLDTDQSSTPPLSLEGAMGIFSW
jgi:TolB protein